LRYPTLGQLRLAPAENVLLWNRFLPPPTTDLEELIIGLITERILEMDRDEFAAAIKRVNL
jgi:hypothetical protein